jgi:RNA ligase
MFKTIHHIDDIRGPVAHKPEIKFHRQPNGVTIGCYNFQDSTTFNCPEALECRGVAFDDDGKIVSRPLHKFFNAGERGEIAAVFEKVDGSMIATCWVNKELGFRSKKSFTSDVVELTEKFLADPKNRNLVSFCEEVARSGHTAIFELTHPLARIVVEQPEPQLRLLHVRNNVTGEYVLLNPKHPLHMLIRWRNIPLVHRFTGLALRDLFESLETMQGQEGYVIQFTDGDMVKVKCSWYLDLHKAITFLRERDIATLALHEELDDVKAKLREAGIDLAQVEAVESRLMGILSGLVDQVHSTYDHDSSLSRKDFAIKYQHHPLRSMLMLQFQDRDIQLAKWYEKYQLKSDFGLRILADGARREAVEI